VKVVDQAPGICDDKYPHLNLWSCIQKILQLVKPGRKTPICAALQTYQQFVMTGSQINRIFEARCTLNHDSWF
jgi:hypothetical protein